MGILDKIKGITSEDVNISKITADKANELISRLGGESEKDDRYLIDNVILFTGAQGGTGVSTLCANVAYYLASKEFGNLSVVIVDMNIMFPTQYLLLDYKEDSEENDLIDVISGTCSIGSSIVKCKDGIDLIYAKNRNIGDLLNAENASAVANMTEVFNTLKELYDVVIVDCPMKIDNMQCNNAMYMCDAIYNVWDEGISSIINSEKARVMLGYTGINSFGKTRVILNKKTSLKYSRASLDKLDMELVEVLPFSTDIIYSSLNGQIYCKSGSAMNEAGGEFASRVRELAAKILAIGGME